jgi:hypothetical protein
LGVAATVIPQPGGFVSSRNIFQLRLESRLLPAPRPRSLIRFSLIRELFNTKMDEHSLFRLEIQQCSEKRQMRFLLQLP